MCGAAFATELWNDLDNLLKSSIHAVTNKLRHGSQMLEQLVQQGDLKIVSAEYSLETAEVKIFHYP